MSRHKEPELRGHIDFICLTQGFTNINQRNVYVSSTKDTTH